MALTKGNSDTTNLALGMGLSRETTHDKTSLYAAAIYNRDKTLGVARTVASTLRFGVRYDRDFSDRWFAYGFTDLERNRLQLLNLRWVALPQKLEIPPTVVGGCFIPDLQRAALRKLSGIPPTAVGGCFIPDLQRAALRKLFGIPPTAVGGLFIPAGQLKDQR